MDTVYSLDTVYKWMTGRSRTAATRTDQPTVEANGSDTFEASVSEARTTKTDDLESRSVDDGQKSQKHTRSEFNDKKTGCATRVSSQHNEPDHPRQTMFPQVNGSSHVNSVQPLYEDIENHADISQLRGGKFVDEDGRTLGPPAFELETLKTRAKIRRKRVETMSRVRDKRNRIVGLRLRLHELRVSLRQDRDRLSVRDAQLVQGLRVVFLENTALVAGPLLEEFERLQEVRNSLQPREDDYDRLEDQLNREEYELGGLEAKLYPSSVSAQISTLADEELAAYDGRVEFTESSLSTHSGPIETSSQVNKYLSRKGDVHMLEERLDELRMERAQIVEEEYARAQVGRGLDDYSRAFLLDFDNRHNELQRELADAQETVARLKMALADRDDYIASPNQFDEAQPEKRDANYSPTTAPDPLLLTDEVLNSAEYDPNERESLLISGTEEPSPVFSEIAVQGSRGSISKASYINQWLLHRLRRSLHEVRRFESTPELQNLNLDQSRLRDLALESWFKDGSDTTFALARKVAAESRNLSVQTTQGLPRPRETKSESWASALQEAVLQARNGQGPALRHSGDASPVQPFTALSPRVARGAFHF